MVTFVVVVFFFFFQAEDGIRDISVTGVQTCALPIYPGGDPRHGVLGLDTTRGDRLFISLLGSAYIHLGWLALTSAPLWGATIISVIFALAVYRWV